MKKTTIYLHSEKGQMHDKGCSLGLTEKQLLNFMYTGYEVKLDIEVDESGQAWVTHCMDQKLPEKVKI